MFSHLRHALSRFSSAVADFVAHPVVQLVVLVGCILWLVFGQSEAALASTLTIGGFLLTQMVLSEQRRRERALHLKIDELLLAVGGARDELAGAEQVSEDELRRLAANRDKVPSHVGGAAE